MVRVYVAHENHTLWQNDPNNFETPMSLGLHQHRTSITMIPLFGQIENVLFTLDGVRRNLLGFKYSSAIRDGAGGFERVAEQQEFELVRQPLQYPRFMLGSENHSVFVPRGQTAAWMIAEGMNSYSYSPLMFSNDPNLEHADFSHLYQPLTQERLDLNMDLLSKFANSLDPA